MELARTYSGVIRNEAPLAGSEIKAVSSVDMGIPIRLASCRHAAQRLLRMLALALGLAASGAQYCAAQTEAQAEEYRVKAAYLYQFGNYVDWPEEAFERPD